MYIGAAAHTLALFTCPFDQVRILLNKFLPTIFMDAMRDNPESSVTMFEGVSIVLAASSRVPQI